MCQRILCELVEAWTRSQRTQGTLGVGQQSDRLYCRNLWPRSFCRGACFPGKVGWHRAEKSWLFLVDLCNPEVVAFKESHSKKEFVKSAKVVFSGMPPFLDCYCICPFTIERRIVKSNTNKSGKRLSPPLTKINNKQLFPAARGAWAKTPRIRNPRLNSPEVVSIKTNIVLQGAWDMKKS